MSERIERPIEDMAADEPTVDEPATESSSAETESAESIASEKEVFEDYYDLVHRLNPDGAKFHDKRSYDQLRDASQEFRKITSAMTHTLEAGGAVARANALMEAITELVHKFDTAEEYANHLINRKDLPSGDELEFNQHYSAGLKAQSEEAERQAA